VRTGIGRVALVGVAAAVGIVTGVACSDTELTRSSGRDPSGGQLDVGGLPRAAPDAPVVTGDQGPPTAAPALDTTTSSAPEGSGDATPMGSVPAAGTGSTPGVPGIDDVDPLCESWSQLIGTRQVLTLAANFGDLDPVAFARLEVIAAPLVRRATVEFADALGQVSDPAVVAERARVLDELVGPLDRRAATAVEALVASGGSDDSEVWLTQVWLDGLRAFGADDVVPALADLGLDLGPVVDAAVDEFVGDAPAWTDDPSLDTSALTIPATSSLLDGRCSDLSSIGVGDAV
jgi:hypothetical protein